MQQENQVKPVFTKKQIEVPVHKSITVTVSCKANLAILNQRIPMAFTRDSDCLTEWIAISESVALVKSGPAHKISVFSCQLNFK